MNRPARKDYHGRSGKIFFTEKYIKELEEYSENLEQRCLSDEWELACLDKDCKKIENKYQKALWALSELMGDKGIYVSLGYRDLYFPSFEELRKWIENDG